MLCCREGLKCRERIIIWLKGWMFDLGYLEFIMGENGVKKTYAVITGASKGLRRALAMEV